MQKIKFQNQKTYLDAKEHLRNPEKIPQGGKIIIYTRKRVKVKTDMVKGKNNTDDALDKINESILLLRSDLNEFKESTNKRFDKLQKESKDRFNKLQKESNKRFDKIDKNINKINMRIDYIVKANKLKDKKH